MPESRAGVDPEAIQLSTGIRVAVVANWIVIAAIVLRMASGGGSLGGLRFVLDTEPLIVVMVGSGLLVASGIVVVGMARRSAWAARASDVLAALAVPGFLLLLGEGHDSAAFGVLAAATALALPRLRRAWSAI